MDIVKLIRTKCIERDITVRKLEQILGFSNGYIQTLKTPMTNYVRAKAIADYLDIPVSQLVNHEPEQKTTDVPDFKPIMDFIEKEHGAGTAEAIKMLLELDPENRAEIRGEMRAMLRNSGKGKE